jgi:glyoxylate reductase
VTLGHSRQIVVAAPMPLDLLNALATAGRVVHLTEEDWVAGRSLEEAMATTVALLVSGYRQVSASLLDAAPHLEVVSTVSVGFDHIDVDAATARGIVVCNTPGVLNAAVAELAILIILTLSRRALANVQAVREGTWSRGDRLPPFGNDLQHKTLGIFGMGRTGLAVAKTASQGFDMQVIYHNRSGPLPAVTTAFPSRYVERSDLFRTADFISVHVDLSPETTRCIGRAEFDLMKPSAYLVNMSRGAVVDESALIEAVMSDRIAGAGLDVMDPEPPRLTNPLLNLDNVVVVPHIGSATVETRRRMAEMAVRNLVNVCNGQAPEAVVNPQALSGRLRSDDGRHKQGRSDRPL